MTKGLSHCTILAISLRFIVVNAASLAASGSLAGEPSVETQIPEAHMVHIPNGADVMNKDYVPQCNPTNLVNGTDIWDCYAYLLNKGNTPCVANPSARFCQAGSIKISGTSQFAGTTETTCRNVVQTLNKIWDVCNNGAASSNKQFWGGSQAAVGNDGLVVHIQPYWVATKRA